MIRVKRSQIGRDRNLGVTLNARQWWVLGWRHARLMTRRWWQVGNTTCFPSREVEAAWRQAPAAFRCLNARQQFRDIHGVERSDFMLWKSDSGGWFYVRPCKHNRHPWP